MLPEKAENLDGLVISGAEPVRHLSVELCNFAVDDGLSVELAGGQVLSVRRVLVATGARDELPDSPVPASAGPGLPVARVGG